LRKGILLGAVVVGGAAFLIFTKLDTDSRSAGRGASQALTQPVYTAQVVPGAASASASPSASVPATTAQPAAVSEEERLLEEGRKAAQAGQTATAQGIFLDLMRRFPSSPVGGQAGVEMALLYKKSGDLTKERNTLSAALAALPEGAARVQVVDELNRISGEVIFSKKPVEGSLAYAVKSGDSLARIGGRLKITPQFIKRANYLTSDRINVGDTLKVFQGPFDVVVEKARFRLTVYLNGVFVKEYRIGIGKNGSTPEGEFYVKNKLIDPVWDPPGPEYAASKAPDNPLGTRWIGFDGEYGIHGTIAPDSIGKSESRGCIRLLNQEVEEVYDLVVIGSKVTVKP
jgi:lipoprotein-anchoring transpeptidase ErfK/SrfK